MQNESIYPTPGAVTPLDPKRLIPMEVHVVAHGIYEDYSIEAIFSTQEKAEAYAEAANRDYKKRFGGRFTEVYYYDRAYNLDPEFEAAP